MKASTVAGGKDHRMGKVCGVLGLALALGLVVGCSSEPVADDRTEGDVTQQGASPIVSKSLGEGHFLTNATINVRGEVFATMAITYDAATGRAETMTTDYPSGYSVKEAYTYGADNALSKVTRTSGDVSVDYDVSSPIINNEQGTLTYTWSETPPASEENTEQTRYTTLTLTDAGDVLAQTEFVNQGLGGSETTTAAFGASKLVESYQVDNEPAENVEGGQTTSFGFTFTYEGTTMSVVGEGSDLSWDLTFDDDGCLTAMNDTAGAVSVSFSYETFADTVNLAHFENQNRVMEAMFEAISATANNSVTAPA